jgi:tRNA G26 N,N-dimethylase Trm1
MCLCGLTEGLHWYVDLKFAGQMFQIAETPEQAEYALRSWAAKILRLGHQHLDVRPLAAKILSTKKLRMIAVCENTLAMEVLRSDGMETREDKV